jgi:hypothetical protein
MPMNVSPDVACSTIFHDDHQTLRNGSGSFATLAAIRRTLLKLSCAVRP